MNTLTFPPRFQVENKISFQQDNSEVNLEISKKEIVEWTYKLAITYLGFNTDNKTIWTVQINDQYPVNLDGTKLSYYGSRKIEPAKRSSVSFAIRLSLCYRWSWASDPQLSTGNWIIGIENRKAIAYKGDGEVDQICLRKSNQRNPYLSPT